mmetsp:Transcript_13192/g.32381  ORF Transcript_13192/g.32381 Transcript_13192/m.32381 type:complete len:119 (-) Transcript_13192:16-372(-)
MPLLTSPLKMGDVAFRSFSHDRDAPLIRPAPTRLNPDFCRACRAQKEAAIRSSLLTKKRTKGLQNGGRQAGPQSADDMRITEVASMHIPVVRVVVVGWSKIEEEGGRGANLPPLLCGR